MKLLRFLLTVTAPNAVSSLLLFLCHIRPFKVSFGITTISTTDKIGHSLYHIGHRQLQRVTIGLRIARMPCEMRTDQNTNPRRLRPTDGLLKPTQATVLHCVRRLYGHTPATILLRQQNLTQLHRLTEHQTRSLRRRCALASLVYENVTRALWPIWRFVWPIWLWPMSSVADIVVSNRLHTVDFQQILTKVLY